MAAKLHYRDGGVWRTAQALHYRDAGTWRKLKAAWYRDGGTWRQIFSGEGPVAAWGGSTVSYVRSGATATAGVIFNTDGTLTDYGTASAVSNLPGGSLWFSLITTGIGSSYWVRANGGSWVSLATAQSFGVSRATVGTTSTAFTFDLAATSGGTVLASGVVTCTAERI
jgi:hypothetical protein